MALDAMPGTGHGAVLVNERTRAVVAERVELAVTRQARRTGLLGRTHLESGHALLLSPCLTIHTAFMRFPIDVVFLAADGRAVKLVRDLKPWRAAMSVRAHAVVELAAGALRAHDIRVGDRLEVTPDTARNSHQARAAAATPSGPRP